MPAAVTEEDLTKKQQSFLDRVQKASEKVEAAEQDMTDAVTNAREEGLTWRLIADTLGLPLSTVHNKFRGEDEEEPKSKSNGKKKTSTKAKTSTKKGGKKKTASKKASSTKAKSSSTTKGKKVTKKKKASSKKSDVTTGRAKTAKGKKRKAAKRA